MAAKAGPVTVVTLIGKPGCHLCDDARAVVSRVAGNSPCLGGAAHPDDPELHEQYGEQIPVVLVDGRAAHLLAGRRGPAAGGSGRATARGQAGFTSLRTWRGSGADFVRAFTNAYCDGAVRSPPRSRSDPAAAVHP